MNRKKLINQKQEILKKYQHEKNVQAKRMKKTGPTIFVTDDAKENVSMIKARKAKSNNKKSRGFFVKVIKKNQIVMFVSALCLVGVGYLTYNPSEETNFVSTTLDNSAMAELADIGDATFVSSQRIVDEIEEAKANNEFGESVSASASVNQEESLENSNSSISGERDDSNSNVTKETAASNSNTINNEKETVDTATLAKEQSDYFINSKIDREKMYSQMLESYQKILDNQNISGEQKAIAAQEITNINNQKNSIMIAENLIKTKGLEDVVIFINLDSISVVVKAQTLSKEEIAQIQNIVTRELDTEIPNVHISTR